ncbi:MAG TPA: DUF3102 domain-containing protein [Desulfosporosinus sp.]|nr:DUF3102 domain-containing protein [Desulfosporosinus sp.]
MASPDSDGNPNSSLVTNLTYTQALILLGIPEEDRDEFIAEHDIESMTKLELQQAVKDRDQAIQEKKDLQKDLDLKSSEITQLSTQAKSLEKQVKDYQSKYSAELEKVTSKQRELEAAKEEIPSARTIAELEKKLKTAETKSSGTIMNDLITDPTLLVIAAEIKSKSFGKYTFRCILSEGLFSASVATGALGHPWPAHKVQLGQQLVPRRLGAIQFSLIGDVIMVLAMLTYVIGVLLIKKLLEMLIPTLVVTAYSTLLHHWHHAVLVPIAAQFPDLTLIVQNGNANTNTNT